MQIKDLIHREVVSIKQNSSFKDAIIKMQIANVNSLLVVWDNGELVWILDTATLIKAIIPDYFWQRESKIACIVTEELLEEFIDDSKHLKVSDFMFSNFEVIKEDSSLMEVVTVFITTYLHMLPVVDSENKPIWIITRQWIRKLFVSKLWIEK